MAEDSDISRLLSVPRQVFPIVVPPAQPPVLSNQFQPDEESNPGIRDGAGIPCSHLHPYVMRSKKFGSGTNGDKVSDDTAALTVDLANPDTWERDYPPQLNKVNIAAGGTTGLTPNVTTAAHGIAVGTSVRVVFAGTNSSPSIDGSAIATYVSATVVSLSVPVALTVAATAGTMAIVCDGVTLGPEQRHYKYNSGSGTFEEKVFAREKKWDSCGELYYIGPEVIIQTAIISGSGSASGGLP